MIVAFVCLFFRANNINDTISIFDKIFTNIGIPKIAYDDFIAIGLALTIMFFKDVKDEFNLNIRISNSSSWLNRHIYIVAISLFIILFGVLNGDQFIYFQF